MARSKKVTRTRDELFKPLRCGRKKSNNITSPKLDSADMYFLGSGHVSLKNLCFFGSTNLSEWSTDSDCLSKLISIAPSFFYSREDMLIILRC